MSSPPERRMSPVHVVGIAATPFLPEQDAMLDELVFEVVHGALREAGLRKQDAGLSVAASMDVTDARSISSGLYTAASGGYLNDSYRIEGDSGLAVAAAAQAVAAGDVEVAIAVGVHNPETSGDATPRRRFLEQVSNVAFEPHVDRPVGLTAETVYALHAAHELEHDGIILRDWAALAAAEITAGSGRERSVRRAARTADDVLDATAVAWPLTDLMLPAHSTGAVAVVLASPARAGRCLGRSARITGLGHATGRHTSTGEWLHDPGAPSRAAGAEAYRLAGLTDVATDVSYAEVSAPTPALLGSYVEALGLTHLCADDLNVSGGLRSNFPGLANGGLRLLEVVEQLEERGGGAAGVSHSVDSITGTVTEDVTVMMVEAI